MNPAGRIFQWLDAVPARNEAVAWLVFIATVALAVRAAWRSARGTQPRWFDHGGVFALAIVATLAAFRWPLWFVPYELNPDESQAISGARTLLDYPVYWKHFDGTTHGPLTEYFLLIFGWCGAPFNFVTARIGATLLQATTLIGAWAALRRVGEESTARLAVMPVLAFWSLTFWPDFTHYSTELVPNALIALALWAAATGLGDAAARPVSAGRCTLAGLLLGAVPYAKLQLAPLALLTGTVLLGVLFARREQTKVRRAAILTVIGALTPSLIVGALLLTFGLWGAFHAAYLQSSFGYIDGKPTGLMDMVSDFFVLIAQGKSFAWVFVPVLAYGLWHGRATWTSFDRPRRVWLLATWGALAVAFYSAIVPGRMMAHYLQVFVLPLTLLAGLHLAGRMLGAASQREKYIAIGLFLAVTVAPQLLRRATSYHPYAGQLAVHLAQSPLPASAVILQHAKPSDRLAMWGWQAQVFVETGLAQGTRDTHAAYQIHTHSLRSYYRDRYLRDITRNRPEWFVDAVGPQGFGFTDRTRDGHETFAPLADFIRENYRFVTEADGLRIYRLAGQN